MTEITIEQHNAYVTSLKKQDIYFSLAVVWGDGAYLSVTNNYITYAQKNKKNRKIITAIDNKIAFTLRELFLFANKDSFYEATNEIAQDMSEELMKSIIENTIILNDEEKVYRIIGASKNCETNSELSQKLNPVYELIDNKKSQQFFDMITKKIFQVLKYYKYEK